MSSWEYSVTPPPTAPHTSRSHVLIAVISCSHHAGANAASLGKNCFPGLKWKCRGVSPTRCSNVHSTDCTKSPPWVKYSVATGHRSGQDWNYYHNAEEEESTNKDKTTRKKTECTSAGDLGRLLLLWWPTRATQRHIWAETQRRDPSMQGNWNSPLQQADAQMSRSVDLNYCSAWLLPHFLIANTMSSGTVLSHGPVTSIKPWSSTGKRAGLPQWGMTGIWCNTKYRLHSDVVGAFEPQLCQPPWYAPCKALNILKLCFPVYKAGLNHSTAVNIQYAMSESRVTFLSSQVVSRFS